MNKEEFNELISSCEDTMLRYLGISYPSRRRIVMRSPFREDRNPSFVISVFKGKIYFKDFATGESGNAYDFVKKYCKDPVYFVNRQNIYHNEQPRNPTTQSKCYYDYVEKKWTSFDNVYWLSQGATDTMLTYLRNTGVLKSCEKILYKRLKGIYTYTKEMKSDKLAFILSTGKIIDGQRQFKLYQPFNKDGHKWISKIKDNQMFLLEQLPHIGDKLIITSSFKDAVCLWSQLKIPSIAPQSECTNLEPDVINELKERFDKIYILYDNDETGKTHGKRNAELFGLNYIELPFEQYKDPSELYSNVDEKTFKAVLTKLLTD